MVDPAEDRTRLWNARHNILLGATDGPGSLAGRQRLRPISRLADCINQTLEDLSQTNFLPLVGHVEDDAFTCST